MKKVKHSIILPVYNEEKSLDELSQRLVKVLEGLQKDWEIIFIDDGSTDGSFAKIKKIVQTNPKIKAIRFRKNTGKSAVLSCGFSLGRGEIIITLDADLQDQPEDIPKLIANLDKGYDLVSGWKAERYDSLPRIFASRVFNLTASWLTGVKIHDFNCGFKAYKREVISELKLYGDLYRFIPALVAWQGFKVGEVKISHAPRRHGESKYGLTRYARAFFDLFTIVFLLRFLRRPLHFFGTLGSFFFIAGLAINLYLTALWFSGEVIGRRPLLILGVLLMIIGFQFVSTGLLGEMLVHFQSQNEKRYPIAQKIGRF